MLRRTTVSTVLVFLIALAVSSCDQEQAKSSNSSTNDAADVKAIKEVGNREVAAITRGNTEDILAVYTEDVTFMPPNEPAAKGRAAARAWTERLLENSTVSGRYTESDVIVAGDWAIETYAARLTLTPKAGGEGVEHPVKGIHIYRRQPDGTWKIAQDVWNMDTAAPGTK